MEIKKKNQKTELEKAGREGDNTMGHLTKGEIVIPKAIAELTEVKEALTALFEEAGADIDVYTVGNEKNQINPETGYPEFFFKKVKRFVKKTFKKAVNAVDKLVPEGVKSGVDKLLPESFKDKVLNIDPPAKPKPVLGNPDEAPIAEDKKKKKKKNRQTVSSSRSRLSIGNKQYRAGSNLSISSGSGRSSGPNVAG